MKAAYLNFSENLEVTRDRLMARRATAATARARRVGIFEGSFFYAQLGSLSSANMEKSFPCEPLNVPSVVSAI